MAYNYNAAEAFEMAIQIITQLIKNIVFIFLLIFIVFSQALAQTKNDAQFSQWKANIEEVKQLLEQQDITINRLEKTRQQLAGQRDEAKTIVDANNISLLTLKAQFEALGPAPAEETLETEEITKRREELKKKISLANEPVLKAREIIQQSDVLIEALDKAIRQKSTQTMLVRGPTPLNVTNWKEAANELTTALQGEKKDFQSVLNSPLAGSILRDRLPLSVSLCLLGVIIITFVHGFILRRLKKLYDAFSEKSTVNWPAIAINLNHLLLPSLGTGLILGGFYLLQLHSLGLKKSISYFPLVVIFLIIGHWLGHSLFAPKQKDLRIIKVDDFQAKAGYRIMLFLGFCLSLLTAQGLLEANFPFTEASKAILTLPIILMGSVPLWQLAAIISQARQNIREDSENVDTESAIQATLLILLSQLLRAASIFSVLFIAMGFSNLARSILGPMLATVAILGFCFFIFQITMSILQPLLSKGTTAEESSPTLLPIAVIFFVGMLALPLLALNWGMRWATLVDILAILKEGIKIGDARISLETAFLLAIVFTIGVGATRWLQRFFKVAILPRTRLDIGGQNAIVTGIGYTGLTISALIAISSAGLDLSSLAIFAGALSVGIGFGLQTIASNFVSGIILLIERPIKEGDWIDVAGYSGYVKKISVRSTRVETFDRHDVIIPNAELVAGVVKNMTLSGDTGRVIIPVGVAYGTDAQELKTMLLDLASKNSMILQYPKPSVLFMGLGESSIDFELRCFIKDVNSMLGVRSDMYFAIYNALNEAGIEIPFPQRVITMKQDN